MASLLRMIVLSAELKWGSRNMRERAAQKLGEVGDARAVKALGLALADSDKRVRLEAVRALGKLGTPGIETLTSVLNKRDDNNSTVREAALQALEGIGGSDVLDAFSLALSDPVKSIRAKAGEALRAIKDSRATDLLRDALKDKEPNVRCVAAEMLGRNREKTAISDLAIVLKDRELSVRLAAVEALRTIGGSEGATMLSAGLNDQDKQVRSKAAVALGFIGGDHSVTILEGALSDPDADVRLECVHSLERIGTAPAIQAMSAVLRDPNSTVRIAAIKALGSLKGTHAFDLLAACLDGLDHEERFIAAEVLGSHGDSRCVPYLVGALRDSDQGKQERAGTILAKLGWKPDGEEEEKLYHTLLQRTLAAERALTAVSARKWEEAVQEGTVALLPLAAAARRLNGQGSEVKEVVNTLQRILETSATEATPEQLQAVASLPDQLEWSVKVMTFAGDVGSMMALGYAQRENERRFPVDCSKVKQLAHRELRRRSSPPLS